MDTKAKRQAVRYVNVPAGELPADLYFSVAPENQGQTVEYAGSDGDPAPHEHGRYPAFRRVTDQSRPVGHPARVTYQRRVGKTRRGRDGRWRATPEGRTGAR